MINWKIPVGFAGFGALVSLLAGIIGGNPFGVILLRLVLSAGVCGGLGLGVNLIVNKFLSELSVNPPIQQTKSGEEVDIVIDEHIPLAEEAQGEPFSGPGESEEESAELMEPVEAAEAAELSKPAIEEEPQIDFSEEVEEFEDDVLTLEDADSEEQSIPEEFVPGSGAERIADFEDLDTLPDIDSISPATEQSAPPSKPSRMNPQVEEVVRNQDPENLARAVRTFMKKDQ